MADRRPRVVYVVVDGMTTEAFEQATGSGRAPALAAIRERGSYVRDAVAVFPTITPAATASLVTGEVPARHGIPGMCWYDRDARRFVNYGQSPRAAICNGMGRLVRDFLVNMNSRHLSPDVSTLHESLDALGCTTASINYLIFRGPHVLETRPSPIQRLLFRRHIPQGLPGPKEHYFADLINGASNACSGVLGVRGFDKRMAATDAYAACVTRELLEREAADMILFYLHENDHLSHRNGPASQIDNLAEADRHVAHVLETYGSWGATLDRVGFVVTADHAQSPVSDEEDHIVDLGQVLCEFDQARPGRRTEDLEEHEIAVCGNGRVAFLYLARAHRDRLFAPVVDTLREHPGIDQLMWRDGEHGYVVVSPRGELRFRQVGEGGVADPRGNRWEVRGELGVVSGIVEEGCLRTPEYPLALWRIKSALDLARTGDVVATMRLTWECKDLAGGDHRGGGDHASLHAQDSLIPFVSTLEDPPLHPSTVDVAPHIVSHFEKALAGARR